MPASSIYSTSGNAKATDLAIQVAKDIANREVSSALRNGTLNIDNRPQIDQEFRRIYQQEYYKWYTVFQSQVESSFDNPSPNKKFHLKHTAVRFSKTNQIILVKGDTTAVVGEFVYPIENENLSPETSEAHLLSWPGPLDWLYFNSQYKYKITDYISTLWQQDSQRRIKYSDGVDYQRGVILKILRELLNRNGRIDGPGFTEILLKEYQYQLGPDENEKEPLDIIQKKLLLGKRLEAARFAESKYLWDHAMFLSFLDDSQPPKRDGSFVKILERFTNSVDQKTLKTVYQSLLYRTLETSSVRPHVDNDFHLFAILNANDCDMDFNQTNEIFKLIIASRKSCENHLIKLGYPILETLDPRDDISNLSHTSFSQGDTYASRTSLISNIDMLILNEIWEYCLNLARGESNYIYITNLIPYKLMFAARLLDYGLHDMFASYLNSLSSAMVRIHEFPSERDPFYDWDGIGRCVDYLRRVWEIYKPQPLPQSEPSPPPPSFSPPKSKPYLQQLPESAMDFNPIPTLENSQPDPSSFSPYLPDSSRSSFQQDVPDSSHPEVTQPGVSLQSFTEQTSTENQFYVPPPPPPLAPNIDESNNSRNSAANIPASPIQPLSPPSMNDEMDISSSPIRKNSSHEQELQRQVNNSQLSQTFSLGNIVENTVSSLGRLLPKSNSKEMKLPDDTKKNYIYDNERKKWLDKTNPDDDETDPMNVPPPVINTSTMYQTNNQWTSARSTKSRYPPPSFNRQ